MTGNWFPYLNSDLVDRVNHRIENPTIADFWVGEAKRKVMGNRLGFAPQN